MTTDRTDTPRDEQEGAAKQQAEVASMATELDESMPLTEQAAEDE